MVQDTFVGILGAALIVGSMVVAIESQEQTTSDVEVEGPPPASGTSTWRASNCQAGSLYWTPSLEDLDEVVGPNYDPAPGPLPDRGLFWIFAFDCRSSGVDGLRISPPSGAAALVAIQEPDNTRNVSAPDGWIAVPTWYGTASSPVSEVFEEHGFEHTDAQVGLGSTSTLLGDQVRFTIETANGSLEATMTVTGSATERSMEGALVGTDPDTFSVFSGPEEMQRREDGTATVQTQGTTWVERLNLDPSPYGIAYDTNMAWNFTFEHEPWNASQSSQGNESQLAGADGGVPWAAERGPWSETG